MNIGIYIKGERLDLYDDERINIILKSLELNDLSKIFTDYSQTFSVPATPNNNRIFKHWYNEDIEFVDGDQAFDANAKVDGYIEISHNPFRNGSIQLEGVSLNKGIPTNYKITFFGQVKNLFDRFGDDTLKTLYSRKFWDTPSTDTLNYTPQNSTLDHDYNSTNIIGGISDPSYFSNGDLFYPLISQQRLWRIGTGPITQPGSDPAIVMDIRTNNGAIDYLELKPAVRMYFLMKKIEQFYKISFGSTGLFNRAVMRNLYMWLSTSSEKMSAFGNRTIVELSDANYPGINGQSVGSTDYYKVTNSGSHRYDTGLEIRPSANYESVKYDLYMEMSNDGINFTEIGSVPGVSGRNSIFYTIETYMDEPFYYFRWFVRSSGVFNFNTNLQASKYFSGIPSYINVDQQLMTTNGRVRLRDQLPDIKIKDLITDLVRMFNLVIKPVGENEVLMDTKDNYYKGGEIHELDNYFDNEKADINRVKLFKEITFKYVETSAILGENWRNTYGGIYNKGFGDLIYRDYVSGSEQLKIELKFENMLFERLSNYIEEGDDVIRNSNIIIGSAIDKEYKPVNVKPILFFKNGMTKLDIPIKVIADNIVSGSRARVDVNQIHIISNENADRIDMISESINFDKYLSPNLYGAEIKTTLYENYYKRYIENIYNKKQRLFTYSEIQIPANILTKLTLDDRINIGDRQYRIDTVTVDLVSGMANFTLMNNFYDENYSNNSASIITANIENIIYANWGGGWYDIIFQPANPTDRFEINLTGTTNSFVSMEQYGGVGRTYIQFRISPNSLTTNRVGYIVLQTQGRTFIVTIIQDAKI